MKSAWQPTVVSVNVSCGGIPKSPVDSAEVTLQGLNGDAHDHDKHNTPLQAISIIDIEDLENLRTEGFDVAPGSTGENLTVRNANVDALQIGDRLQFAGGVVLELTKVRQPCYVLDAIDPHLKHVIVDRCGFLARVIRAGSIGRGESFEIVRAPDSGQRAALTHAIMAQNDD